MLVELNPAWSYSSSWGLHRSEALQNTGLPSYSVMGGNCSSLDRGGCVAVPALLKERTAATAVAT